MSESKRDDELGGKPRSPEVSAGILKEKEQKDLEGRIVDTMRSLGSRLTKKEILALAQKIEVSKGLDELRKSLESEAKLSKELSDDVLQEVFHLFQEVRELTESGLKELKLEIAKINPSKNYEIDQATYLSHRFPWVKRLEETELGKNVVIDIEGFLVGALDSAASIVKLLLALMGDLVLLPKHAYEHHKQKKSAGK